MGENYICPPFQFTYAPWHKCRVVKYGRSWWVYCQDRKCEYTDGGKGLPFNFVLGLALLHNSKHHPTVDLSPYITALDPKFNDVRNWRTS